MVSTAVDEKPSSVLATTVLSMHTEYQNQMEKKIRSEARKREQEEEEARNESYMISRLVRALPNPTYPERNSYAFLIY